MYGNVGDKMIEIIKILAVIAVAGFFIWKAIKKKNEKDI